jgi:Xaa-Pro aminopeptidase
MPAKEKNSPIKRGDFVLIDAATKLNKADAVATDQTWTGYVGVISDGREAAVDR